MWVGPAWVWAGPVFISSLHLKAIDCFWKGKKKRGSRFTTVELRAAPFCRSGSGRQKRVVWTIRRGNSPNFSHTKNKTEKKGTQIQTPLLNTEHVWGRRHADQRRGRSFRRSIYSYQILNNPHFPKKVLGEGLRSCMAVLLYSDRKNQTNVK